MRANSRWVSGSLVTAIAGVLVLVPTPASAGTVAVVSEELLIGDRPGEANHIIVELVENRFLISDRAGMEAGAGCVDQGENVSCRAKNVVLAVIQTGDQNDTVRVTGIEAYVDGGTGDDNLSAGTLNATLVGGPGDDRLRGGLANDVLRGGGGSDALRGDRGEDVLKGGGGDDDLHSRDGERDIVSGGGGTDEGTVDRNDKVRRVEVLGDF